MDEGSAERWLEALRDLASYRPSDFLMFAPRTYWRLFELHNEAWWPLPLVLPAFGLAALWWSWRGVEVGVQRAAAAGLAVGAAFVGWAFVFERYAAINWAAGWLSLGWAMISLLLLALAFGGPLRPAMSVWRRRLGAGMALSAFIGYPLLAPLMGRPFTQSEVFGLAPEPTLLAVLAWLQTVVAKPGGALWIWRAARSLTLLLCLVSAATMALLGEWVASAWLAAAVVAAFARFNAEDDGGQTIGTAGSSPPRS